MMMHKDASWVKMQQGGSFGDDMIRIDVESASRPRYNASLGQINALSVSILVLGLVLTIIVAAYSILASVLVVFRCLFWRMILK